MNGREELEDNDLRNLGMRVVSESGKGVYGA